MPSQAPDPRERAARRRRRVLLVDDDPRFHDIATSIFRGIYELDCCHNVEEAAARLARRRYSAILCDLEFHPRLTTSAYTGAKAVAYLHERSPDTPIIVITKSEDLREVSEAFRAGAFYYVNKYFQQPEVVQLVERAISALDHEHQAQLYRVREQAARDRPLVYGSAAMRAAMAEVDRFAPSPLPVLITGESGTGKDLVARELHERSGRSGPYTELIATAFSAEMFEAQLFGWEKGSFTGADRSFPGLIRMSDGGTVFIDEVGALPVDRQAKLLRVIQNGRVRPIGGLEERPADVRFVFATNEDLAAKIEEGGFREDLWFRISGLQVELPPLRDRGDDAVLLARHFVERGSGGRVRLGEDVPPLLRRADFEGNVRRLEQCIERALLHDDDGVLDAGDLQRSGFCCGALEEGGTRPRTLLELARTPIAELLPYPEALAHVERALREAVMDHGYSEEPDNIAARARLLGVTRQTLHNWIRQMGREQSARAAGE